MATTVAPTPAQAADLLQKLSLDSKTKDSEIPEKTKKLSANQYVDSNAVGNVQIPSLDRSMTPLLQGLMDPSMCFLSNGYPSPAYFYGGYDGVTDWDEYARYMNPDGVEMSPGIYGDNGSMGYHHCYGYAPYAPYSPASSPVPTMGPDGQLYSQQQYPYATPYYQPLAPSSELFSPSPAVDAKGDISTAAVSDQKPLSVEPINGNSNGNATGGGAKGNNGSAPLKSTHPKSSYNSNGSFGKGGGIHASGYQGPRYSYDALRSSLPWSDCHATDASIIPSLSNANNVVSSRNQNLRSQSQYMGLNQPRQLSAQGFMNRMYPNKLYGQYGNTARSGFGYGSSGYDSRVNGRAWFNVDNGYKARGRGNGFYGYGNENMDGLNELNRGPRAKGLKNQKGPITLAVKGQNIFSNGTNEEEKATLVPDHKQYNLADFPVDYTNAKFFVIKSYSEDDVHKSIKYNVWASTPNGNKKLDSAYQEALAKSSDSPVFLFFSVNTSGQFVGLAEMAGPVDFNKNLEYWQQDKWNGFFSVKWHIVKDIPNSLLRHIILENNENKPVTNSRDTQEVKLEQGLQMLKIFKEHSSKTSILDDFGFYESRQKTIQEKKAKQQQFQKQVWEGKTIDERQNELTNGVVVSQKPSQISSDGSVAATGDVPKATKPVVLEKIVSNGC